MFWKRYYCALVNFADEYLLILGGYRPVSGPVADISKTVEKYSIFENAWSKFPSLNIGRIGHSASCLNKTSLYVFCGYNVE